MSGATVVIVGLGNIGSQAIPLIARMALQGLVAKVILDDSDAYAESNLGTQAVERRDVGRSKARVQKRRLEKLAPGLEVVAFAERLERVPPGLLRADAILAGLDSRAARIALSEVAWMLGVPLIDGGVDGEQGLARVDVFVPGPDAPCMECVLSDADYQALEVVYPCQGEAGSVRATGAPAELGSLTASLMVSELRRLLADPEAARGRAGQRVVLETEHHRHSASRLTYNPSCRRQPHAPLEIDVDAAGVGSPLGELLANDVRALRVHGTAFFRERACSSCGATRAVPGLLRRGAPVRPRRCGRCAGELVPRRFDLTEWLDASTLTPAERRRPLARLGLEEGDLITLRRDGGAHHHLTIGSATGSGSRARGAHR